MVATVERGLLERLFWSIEIAGERPTISSTSGFCICLRNWRAYAERDSTYRRCPSAKIVSKASDDFPEPESPVITVSLFRGIDTLTFLRLCMRAPFTRISSIRLITQENRLESDFDPRERSVAQKNVLSKGKGVGQ